LPRSATAPVVRAPALSKITPSLPVPPVYGLWQPPALVISPSAAVTRPAGVA